jgi:hypothetical protein
MEAIARRTFVTLIASAVARARDPVQDALRKINHVATALSDGDAVSAMNAFDRSYPNCDRLQGYFAGLVDAYQIANEADVADQEVSGGEVRLTLDWSLTLTNRTNQTITRRSAEIHARLRPKKRNWSIVDFAPIDLFDPQVQSSLPRLAWRGLRFPGNSGRKAGGTRPAES